MKGRLRFSSIVIWICLLCQSYSVYSQEIYSRYIDSASQRFESKEYVKAAQLYSKAFQSNKDRGVVAHRYNAARSWALAGVPDSALYQLNRIAKAGYYKDLDKLKIDSAFISLRNDVRWTQLIAVVQANGIELQPTQIRELNALLVALLDTIRRDDQLYRNAQMLAIQKHGYQSTEAEAQTQLMLRYDSLNQQKVARIFNQYGWPYTESIGKDGNQTIFLVLQHSGLSMRLKYLHLVNDAYKRGQINPSEMALFTDRTNLMQGKKQTYGTQVITDSKTGKSYLQPINDPEHVDERRSAFGLQPMKQYVSQWNINWSIDLYYQDLSQVQALTHIY
ncbi:MAG: DUF6624 domain-containing protein [Bacteroidota bacterium]